MLNSDDEQTVLNGLTVVEAIGEPLAVDAMMRLAGKGSSAPVRARAIEVLAQCGVDAAIDAMIDALTDNREAPQALFSTLPADMGPIPPAVMTTAPATQATPNTVADWAAAALRKLTGQDFGFASDLPPDRRAEIIRMWRTWRSEHKPAA